MKHYLHLVNPCWLLLIFSSMWIEMSSEWDAPLPCQDWGTGQLVPWLYALQDKNSVYLPIYSIILETQLIVGFFFFKLCWTEWHKQSNPWTNLPRRCYLFCFQNFEFFCSFAREKPKSHPYSSTSNCFVCRSTEGSTCTCLASLTVNIYIHQSKHVFQ